MQQHQSHRAGQPCNGLPHQSAIGCGTPFNALQTGRSLPFVFFPTVVTAVEPSLASMEANAARFPIQPPRYQRRLVLLSRLFPVPMAPEPRGRCTWPYQTVARGRTRLILDWRKESAAVPHHMDQDWSEEVACANVEAAPVCVCVCVCAGVCG